MCASRFPVSPERRHPSLCAPPIPCPSLRGAGRVYVCASRLSGGNPRGAEPSLWTPVRAQADDE
jgi:hypothetical protein